MAKLSPDTIEWILKLNASQAQKEIYDLEKSTKDLQKENKEWQKLMSKQKVNSPEWKKYNDLIKANNKLISENGEKIKLLRSRLDVSTMTVKQLKARLGELKREFNDTSKATNPARYQQLRKEMGKIQAALDKAKTEARGLNGAFFSLAKMKETLTGFFFQIGASVLTLVTGAFRDAFNIVVDFEKANARLASVLGTSKTGVKELTDAARQLGATTSYSAAEVTGLQIELAKLGFAKQDILDMEAAVLKFATAVGTDLSSASAFTGAALRIFGKDASEAENVLASFAVATTKTALDFSKLQTSLSIVGPVAASFGLSLEDTTALLGQLANAGFDASSAATATRNILLSLADANGDLAKALGHPEKSAEGLAEGLKKLNAEGIDLAKALELTDKRSVAAFSTFLDNAATMASLKDSITGVNEEFNAMSETMSNTVAGSMAGLRSAAEELVLKISEGSEVAIRDVIETLTEWVRKIGDGIVWLQKYSKEIKTLVIVFLSYKTGVLAVTATTKLWNTVVGLSMSLIRGLRATVELAKAAFNAWKAAITGATIAQKGLQAAMAATPWGAVVGLVFAAITAYNLLTATVDRTVASNKAYEESQKRMKENAEAHAKALTDLNEKIATEKRHLSDLLKIAENEKESKEKRLKAIKEINKVCPEYNGYLDEERGRLIANKDALDKYILSMEKRMRLAYYKDEYQKYIHEEEAAKLRAQREVKVFNEHRNEQVEIESSVEGPAHFLGIRMPWRSTTTTKRKVRRWADPYDTYTSRKDRAKEEYARAQGNREEFVKNMNENGFSLAEVLTSDEDSIDTAVTQPANGAAAAAGRATTALTETIDKVKELNARLKELRKKEPESDEEYKEIEAEKARIQKQLKALKGTDSKKNKKHHEAGTYKEDSIDEATAAADDLHQKNLLDINKQKGEIAEADLIIKKNEEMIRYCGDLSKALDELKAKTDPTHAQTLDKITAEQNKVNANLQKAQQELDMQTYKKEQSEHSDRLKALQVFYETQEQTIREAVNSQTKMEEEADIYLMIEKKRLHEGQLKELEAFKEKTEKADYLGAETQRQNLEKINDDIRSMQSQVLTDTGEFSAKLRSLMTDTTSRTGIKESFDLQRRALESSYTAMLSGVEAGSEEAVALEREKLRRMAALNYQYREQMWQLQEMTGLSWADEYDRELAKLENAHRQGLILEKDYQRKRLEMGVNNAKKYFDYYAQISGSMFSAIQEAEIAKSDAKYDILIQQAKNNGEETTALEEEKENKKLEIQKRYADVNFAIKVSQIVADTAVSIMKAFADLGPIGGAVAAALLSATGIAQAVSAKAERDKIKNMQPSKTASTSAATTPATAKRVLSGYSDGGYTGDGDRYEVAGVVHRGEYVVPKPIMAHPRVIDAVGTIEAIRRNRLRSSSPLPENARGFADGGFTSGSVTVDTSGLTEAVRELKEAASNIRAYVVLRDIEKASADLQRARDPFTRKR